MQQFPATSDQDTPVNLTFLRAGGTKCPFQVELKLEVHGDPHMKSWIKWSRDISTARSAAGYNLDQPEVDVGRVTQTET